MYEIVSTFDDFNSLCKCQNEYSPLCQNLFPDSCKKQLELVEHIELYRKNNFIMMD